MEERPGDIRWVYVTTYSGQCGVSPSRLYAQTDRRQAKLIEAALEERFSKARAYDRLKQTLESLQAQAVDGLNTLNKKLSA